MAEIFTFSKLLIKSCCKLGASMYVLLPKLNLQPYLRGFTKPVTNPFQSQTRQQFQLQNTI
jgi:hypothetical protein